MIEDINKVEMLELKGMLPERTVSAMARPGAPIKGEAAPSDSECLPEKLGQKSEGGQNE